MRSTIGLLGALLLASACADAPPPEPQAPPPPAPLPAVATPAPATPAAPTQLRRAVLFSRQSFGSSLETTAPDGTVTIAYDVHQNGRGPHCDATIRRAPDGTLGSFEAHGHQELGAQVDETFSIEGNHAHWRGPGDSGEREVAGPAFYVPASSCPHVFGMLAEALLRAGKPLALLPSGEARLEREGETTVRVGTQSRHLTSYALTGLQLAPVHAWMDDGGRWSAR